MSTDLTHNATDMASLSEDGLIDTKAAMPAHIAAANGEGTEGFSDIVSPPLIKVVQGMSGEELIEELGLGTVYIDPTMEVVAKKDESFVAIPIHYGSQFIRWAPRSSDESILDISNDPKGDLAKLCRDPKLRRQPLPSLTGSGEDRCLEHLNFVLLMRSASGEECLAAVSFKSAEYKVGKQLASQIFTKQGCPIYGQVFNVGISSRKNAQGTWYGLNFTRPSWTPEAMFDRCKALHQQFKDSGVDYSEAVSQDSAAPETSAPSSEDEAKF